MEGAGEGAPGLPRSSAQLPQRDRLVWSIVRVAAEKGYEGITLDEVVSRAGVSKSTFYDEFEDKDDCLFTAYDMVVEELVRYVERGYRIDAPWPERIRGGLEALLGALAAEPEVARMATVAFPAAGPAAQRRYREALERFLPFLEEGRTFSSRGERLPAGVELMAVGGAEVIVVEEVMGGRARGLPEMLPEILFAVLVPFVGPERATAEMRRARSEP